MNITVKKSQPRPVVEKVTIVFEHEDARVMKLLASYRERIVDLLDETISEGKAAGIDSAQVKASLYKLWRGLHSADIHWSK